MVEIGEWTVGAAVGEGGVEAPAITVNDVTSIILPHPFVAKEPVDEIA